MTVSVTFLPPPRTSQAEQVLCSPCLLPRFGLRVRAGRTAVITSQDSGSVREPGHVRPAPDSSEDPRELGILGWRSGRACRIAEPVFETLMVPLIGVMSVVRVSTHTCIRAHEGGRQCPRVTLMTYGHSYGVVTSGNR